jgi:flagellar L-ring protein precursor FlgH
MAISSSQQLRRVSLLLLFAASLSACNAITRVSQVGTAPPITPIENPIQAPGYRVVSLPMPQATNDQFMSNSLWRQGARAFFKDQRANRVGDILTVVINIDDQASFNNETERRRENTEDSDVTNLLGLETQLEKRLLPESFNPASALSLPDLKALGRSTAKKNLA